MKRRLILPAALVLAGLVIVGSSEAAVRTWTGLGTDNNWSTVENWSGGVVPGSGDTALFDSTTNKNAVVDAAFGGTVDYLTMTSDYTGTNTLNRSLLVRIAYAQTNGVFDGTATNLTVGVNTPGYGNFTLAGGTFHSPSNTLKFDGYNNTIVRTGGTFNHNNGTVLLSGIYETINLPDVTFYGLTVDRVEGNYSMAFTAGITNVVLGNLTHNRLGIRYGTFDLRGSLIIGPSAGGGDATIAFLTAGDQTIVCSNGATCGLYINKPSGSVSAVGGDLKVGTGANGASGNFILEGGTFNSSSNTFYFNSYANTWAVSGGTFNHNNGTVYFTSYEPRLAATNVTFYGLSEDLPVATSGNNSIRLPAGATNVVLGNLTQVAGGFRNTGTLDLRGNLIVGNGAIVGGNGIIAFLTAGDQSIVSSTGTTCSLLINKPSGSVTVAGNTLKLRATGGGLDGGHFTLAGGTFNAPTNLFLIESYNSVLSRSGGAFNPGACTLHFQGWNATINASNQAFHKLIADLPITVGTPGNGLTVTSGTTNTVLSTFVHSNGLLKTGALIVQGDVIIGTNANGGTASFIYGGSNDQTYVNVGTNISGAVTVNKSAGRVILASPMAYTNANQDMTIATGTVDLAGYPLTVTRTLTLGEAGKLKFNGTEQATAKDVTVLPGAGLELRVP